MSHNPDELPPEIIRQVLAFRTEHEDGSQTTDTIGLVKFVRDNMDQYPALRKLIQINEEAVIKHVQETGQPVPGVKVIKTTTAEGSNVTTLEIFQDLSTKARVRDESR
jgi:hypothetical protein